MAQFSTTTSPLLLSSQSFRPGDPAEDAKLHALDGTETTFFTHLKRAQDLGKPLVVFAGSITWPPFRQQVKEVHQLLVCSSFPSFWLLTLKADYGDRVEWMSIYLKEAHAQDVWPLGQHACINDHKTLDDRYNQKTNFVHFSPVGLDLKLVRIIVPDFNGNYQCMWIVWKMDSCLPIWLIRRDFMHFMIINFNLKLNLSMQPTRTWSPLTSNPWLPSPPPLHGFDIYFCFRVTQIRQWLEDHFKTH